MAFQPWQPWRSLGKAFGRGGGAPGLLSSSNPVVVAIGDSQTAGDPTTWTAWPLWEQALDSHVVQNKGVTGTTVSTLYARIATDVLPYTPGYCSVLIGTNDLNNGAQTPQYVEGFWDQISIFLLNNGFVPIWLTIPPRTAPDVNRAVTNPLIVTANAWLRAYCVAKGYPLADVWTDYFDPNTNDVKVGYLNAADGLHPTALGAQRIAIITTAAANLAQFYAEKFPLDATNLLPNPGFTLGGVPPTGWGIQGNAGVNATFSTSVHPVFGKWFQVVQTATSGAKNSGLNCTITTALVASTKYRWEMDLEWSGSGLTAPVSYFYFNGLGVPIGYLIRNPTIATITGMRFWVEFTTPVGYTSLTIITQSSAADGFTIKIGRASLTLVP